MKCCVVEWDVGVVGDVYYVLEVCGDCDCIDELFWIYCVDDFLMNLCECFFVVFDDCFGEVNE